MTKEKRY